MDSLPSFGRYEALFRIAAGGMAEVFAARMRGEAGFERLVAVKRMLPHIAEDEHFVDMFLDEARLAVHVSSPHVVQTMDLGRAEDGALYIVMDLVVGSALSALIRDVRKRGQRVPVPIAVEIIAQAAQGLDDAHEAATPTGIQLGIVHRDVSPHNLLVGIDGRTRVTDFGIARAMLRRTSTAVGELKGKFAYFSPEQAEGQQVDRRADLFALGIVAWETLVGRRLFTGDDSLALLTAVKTQVIPPLAEVDDEVPQAVSRVVARALERDRERRYQTGADFATALRDAGRVLGPAPTSREIGRWVGDAGGEALAKMRGKIDAALVGDDLETVARSNPSHPRVSKPQSDASSQPGVSRAPDARPAPPAAPAPTQPLVAQPPIFPASNEPSSTTVGATSVETEISRLRGGRSRTGTLLVLFALVAVAGVAVFFATRTDAPSTPVPAAESAPFVTPTPPPAPSAPIHPSASVEASVHTPKAPPRPKFSTAPTVPTGKAAAPVTTTTTTTTTTPTPTPAPEPTPTPKKPIGPTLGDDMFKPEAK